MVQPMDTQLDPEIAALADAAQGWLACAAACAAMLECTLPHGIEAMLVQERASERLYTGYMPEEQRRDMRHRLYSEGLRTPGQPV